MKDSDLTPRPLLRRREAAHYLKVNWGFPKARALWQKKPSLAVVQNFEAGPWPLYDTPDLDEWARSELSNLVASTSELPTRHHQRPAAKGDEPRVLPAIQIEPPNRRNGRPGALRHRDETSAEGRRG